MFIIKMFLIALASLQIVKGIITIADLAWYDQDF